MKLLLTLFLFLFQLASCQLGTEYVVMRKDQACEPSTFGLDNFTGIRIQHQVVLGRRPSHHLRFSWCHYGEHLTGDAYLPMRANETGDYVVLPWGGKVCALTSRFTKNCFMMARHKDYAYQTVPITIPGQVLGGMYRCDDVEMDDPGYYDDGVRDEFYGDNQPCIKDEDVTKRAPEFLLIADEPYFAWIESANERHWALRTPFAMAVPTPFTSMNTMEFVQSPHFSQRRLDTSSVIDFLDVGTMSPFEDYTYTAQELARREAADAALRANKPLWDGWFQAPSVSIPKNYNTFMGNVDNCGCGKVLQKFLDAGANSTEQVVQMNLLNDTVSPGFEQQCLLQYPQLFDKSLGQMQYAKKQARYHLMPFHAKSIFRYLSHTYIGFHQFLRSVEDAYHLE